MIKANYDEIKKKIQEMNITSSKNSFKKYKEKEISKIEKKYGFRFPEEYRLFLLEYGNSYFNIDGSCYTTIEKQPRTAEDGFATIGGFYGLGKGHDNIIEGIECYLGRMPQSLIPIADDGCDNQICIGVSGGFLNKIYFWDHENEMEAKIMLGYMDGETAEIDQYNMNLYMIAGSFKDFIMNFTVKEYSESQGDFDGVEIWLSDDLL